MKDKVIKTVLAVLAVLFAITLWSTKQQHENSLSAFAFSENVLWYRLMHLSIIAFFLIDVNKNVYDYFIALGMACVLAFDMYHFPVFHNIITACSLLLACFSLIYNSTGFSRSLFIFLSGSAVIYFVVGFFNPTFHFLLAEILTITIIMNGMLYNVWKVKA